MTQQKQIPTNYVAYNNSNINSDLFFYWNNDQIKPVGLCYTKKSKKPKWHYRFKDYLQFETTIKKTIDGHNDHKKEVEDRRKKRFAPHSLKVNDILYCSWGYDQTNIDFYKVTQLIGKNKIEVVKCKNKITGSGCQSDYVVPGDIIPGSEKNYVVNSQYNSIRVYSFASARKWNGEAKYQTDSLSGH